MYVRMSWSDICLLLELLDQEIASMEQRIGREQLVAGIDPLTRRWQQLESLRHGLRQCECDVLA